MRTTASFPENAPPSNLTNRASSPVAPLQIQLDRASWDDLAKERMAIMWADAGIQETMAKSLAMSDTVRRFGPRPAGGSK